jgi:hypothetical protein
MIKGDDSHAEQELGQSFLFTFGINKTLLFLKYELESVARKQNADKSIVLVVF